VASVVNWSLTGTGESQQEAFEDLSETFAAVKSEKERSGKVIPRPGTRVPISLAARDRVDTHSELADEFILRILGLESAWISDESSLWDFNGEETNDTSYRKIKEVYGVDVSDIKSVVLVDIFDRIAASRERK
jgi:hypothetical protein